MSTRLDLSYAGADPATVFGCVLEQEPVPSNRLTLDALEAMLALVRSGQSARAYRSPDCPVTIDAEGLVTAMLNLWVWPRPLDLDYGLDCSWGTVGERIQVAMPREFDLVVNFERHLRLPFLTSSLSCQWAAMGCFDRRSNPVEPPEVAVSPGAVHVRGEVVGVLRVRCTALGWLHGIVLPFSPADSLEDIETVATASWAVGAEPHTAQLSLELPGCLEDLLALCPDGSSMASRARGELIPQDKILPTVYYSDCTGEVLEVRRERA